jgi:hypothetical protein
MTEWFTISPKLNGSNLNGSLLGVLLNNSRMVELAFSSAKYPIRPSNQ